MQCPKCRCDINENDKVCPNCHKVFLLECPNCGALSETSTCNDCGYLILTKCSKCSKLVPTANIQCPSCGFSVNTSIAHQECESDDFVSVIIEFENLKKIRKLLKSKSLYLKFFIKLKNILLTQVKKNEGKLIIYDDLFVMNFNKELSFATSSEKSIRFALKVINAFSELNINIKNNLSINLGLNIKLIKKHAEKLLIKPITKTNVKPLNIKRKKLKYLNGLQILLDQYVRDVVSKTYKTDSLYSTEIEGQVCNFYEVILDSYVFEPELNKIEDVEFNLINKEIIKINDNKNKNLKLKVFDINAKCNFIISNAASLVTSLKTLDLKNKAKILSLKSSDELRADSIDIIKYYEEKGYKIIYITYNEQMNYSPWYFFESILKIYYNLPYNFKLTSSTNINDIPNSFATLFDFCMGKTKKANTPEDARYAYMELWGKFLSTLMNTVIIVDNFKYIDDTTIQTLDLFFDNYKNISPNFVFITDQRNSLHSKIKKVLQLQSYTEIELLESPLETCINVLKSDAKEFINSFYYEKLSDIYDGSYLFFKTAIEYLKEVGVLIEFENKIIVKDTISVMLPNNLANLFKARLKNLSKNNNDVSYIFAYSIFLLSNLNIKTLARLNISNLKEVIEYLEKFGIVYLIDDLLIIMNYPLISKGLLDTLNFDIIKMLVNTIENNIGKYLNEANLAFLKEKINLLNDEYSLLNKNAKYSLEVGDFDAYLKCNYKILGLIDRLGKNINSDEIDAQKNNIYNTILMSLCSYAPTKIYPIEKILLENAMQENDNSKINKLSNLMLQAGLIASIYTEAPLLIHNILTRMENPVIIANGEINIKFLLLTFVRLEVLFNVGKYDECVEISNDLIKILNKDIIEVIKPDSFSIESFVNHISENFKLVALSKLFRLDDDIEDFLNILKDNVGIDLPDKDAIVALSKFLAGKNYKIENIENLSSYSKILFLILQEFALKVENYNIFAQNIYQAKLLAEETNQKDLKLFCELLIGYAYYKEGAIKKAETIYKDIINIGLTSSIFHIQLLGQYFLAIMEFDNSNIDNALYIINEAFLLIEKFDNQAKFFYIIFKKLYIDIAEQQKISSYDKEYECQQVLKYQDKLKVFFD